MKIDKKETKVLLNLWILETELHKGRCSLLKTCHRPVSRRHQDLPTDRRET